MPTLLLQCVGPMQAWDTQSNFGVRTTGREPSKSGIIGLLCAALGRPRSEPLTDLAELRMGVRVDQEGRILRDWHTAGKGGYLRASGKIETKTLITSTRYYLSDAAFLVGLESEERDLLLQLQAALRDPHWMLFLGRKACVPSSPPYLPDGLRDQNLLAALQDYEWIGRSKKLYENLGEEVRLILEDDDGSQVRNDNPISFEKGERKFASRQLSTQFIAKPLYRRAVTQEDET